jgi:hypothetical protein
MPKILDVRIDNTTPNSSICVLIDDSPCNPVFEERNNLYLGIDGDVADIFYYDKPGTGMNGAKLYIEMKDGSCRCLEGPWSSNDVAINEHFPETKIVHVQMTSNERLWSFDKTSYYGYVTEEALAKAFMKQRGYVPPDVRGLVK